jgi:predicted ATPase
MRYRLLEPVRQYAEARLVESGAWEVTRRRHAEYFLGLVEAGEEGLKGADHEVWRARLELEHDNVRGLSSVAAWTRAKRQRPVALVRR